MPRATLPLASLAAIMDCEESEVVELARSLQAKLTSEGSGLTVQRVAGGYQLVTRPETYATVERLSQVTDRHLGADGDALHHRLQAAHHQARD